MSGKLRDYLTLAPKTNKKLQYIPWKMNERAKQTSRPFMRYSVTSANRFECVSKILESLWKTLMRLTGILETQLWIALH